MALVRYSCRCGGSHRVEKASRDDAWSWSVRLEQEAQGLLEQAFLAFRQRILDAIEILGDVSGRRIMDVLPWDEAERDLLTAWEAVARQLLLAAGNHQTRSLGLPEEAFNLDNPYALEWMKTHGSELITEVTQSTKDAVRVMVQAGVAEGDTVRDIARTIRLSGRIGLRSDQISAADSYRHRLEQSGTDPDTVDRNTSAYEARLLRQRTMLISRTETGNGLTEGTRQAWQVARDRKYIPPKSKRRWNAGAEVDNKGRKRTCRFCLDFSGQLADLDGEYTSKGKYLPKPVTSKGPTADSHPACRCSESIITDFAE